MESAEQRRARLEARVKALYGDDVRKWANPNFKWTYAMAPTATVRYDPAKGLVEEAKMPDVIKTTDIHTRQLEAEVKRLMSERDAIYRDYANIKDELHKVREQLVRKRYGNMEQFTPEEYVNYLMSENSRLAEKCNNAIDGQLFVDGYRSKQQHILQVISEVERMALVAQGVDDPAMVFDALVSIEESLKELELFINTTKVYK